MDKDKEINIEMCLTRIPVLNTNYYHYYLICNDKIKKGDYILINKSGIKSVYIIKQKKNLSLYYCWMNKDILYIPSDNIQKVVATTRTELLVNVETTCLDCDKGILLSNRIHLDDKKFVSHCSKTNFKTSLPNIEKRIITEFDKLNKDSNLVLVKHKVSKSICIDPPSGWKYGFPKTISAEESEMPMHSLLLSKGYPQSEIAALGDSLYVRFFETHQNHLFLDDNNTVKSSIIEDLTHAKSELYDVFKTLHDIVNIKGGHKNIKQ
jgi:hypothetical protein